MHARYFNAVERAALNERIFVLADLIALGDIGIKIIFAVKLGKVSRELCLKRRADEQHLVHRLFINYRQSARVRHAYRANIFVGLLLVGVVEARAKHLGARL